VGPRSQVRGHTRWFPISVPLADLFGILHTCFPQWEAYIAVKTLKFQIFTMLVPLVTIFYIMPNAKFALPTS